MSEAAGLSWRELEGELATLAAHLAAGMCRWLELVAEAERRGTWNEFGCDSCAEWLAWRCALTPRSAREHVRVARRLAELPLVHEAFSRGELSYAKVRAVTRVAEPHFEAELVQLARVLTAAQLERTLSAYRRVTTREAQAVLEGAYLTCFWDEDGGLVVRGRLAPEDGALFLRALEVVRDRLWRDEQNGARGSAEPRPETRRATSVDALAAIADAALGHEAQRSGGDRHQVVVHVDEAVLARDGDGSCVLADGPAIAPETARRLACDASVVRGTGRKTRSIPPALRRALVARDHGCRFPGCNNRIVDAHHIRHWASGGETSLANLLLLCRRHHRLVHEGGYSVDSSLCFYYPWGHPIPAVPRPPPGSADALRDGNDGLDISPDTCETGHGDPLDLGHAVEGLLQLAAR